MNIRIGSDVRRKEDLRLVTGAGCFSDDVNLPGQAYAVMVRSPHAHARIRSIATARGARHRRRARGAHRRRPAGRRAEADPAPADAARRARHHAAQSRRQRADDHAALSAARRQGPLRRRSGGDGGRHLDRRRQDRRRAGRRGLRAARCRSPARWPRPTAGAPSVFKDGTNVCVDADVGDAAATEAAFKRAAHIVSLDT